jgi:LPS sulfotransferase NodH
MKSRLYLLCTTSRTGSTHLCRLLAATGRLGSPEEFFNEPQMSQAMRHHNIPTERDYVTHIFNATSTPNGVCGIKLATDAFARLRHALGEHELQALAPKYIWLRRRDGLRQAISLYRAAASGVWHWPAGKPRPAADVPFDAARIRQCEAQIAAANAEWSQWFTATKITPLELWYENVALSAPAAIRAIARYVNAECVSVEHESAETMSPLQVLRDARTEHWVRRLQESRPQEDIHEAASA